MDHSSVTEDNNKKKTEEKEGEDGIKRRAEANCGSLVTPETKKAKSRRRPIVKINFDEKNGTFFYFAIFPVSSHQWELDRGRKKVGGGKRIRAD